MAALTRLVVHIVYLDGRDVRYRLTPKLQMTFEKFTHINLDKIDEGVTNAYKLAYHVQMANKDDFPGIIPGDFEAWLDLVDVAIAETEEIVPFDKAAANGGSANSLSLQESVSVT